MKNNKKARVLQDTFMIYKGPRNRRAVRIVTEERKKKKELEVETKDHGVLRGKKVNKADE